MRPRVLVLCPSGWDRAALGERFRDRFDIRFFGAELVESPSLLDGLTFDVFRWSRRAADAHRGAGLDGVVGTGDYPACMLAPLVARDLGLRAPDPRAVVLLSHKFYSREIQRRVIPEATPSYRPIDPYRPPPLAYPVFVKPVKGTMSIRAQLVRDEGELRRALRFPLRERITKHLLLRPFQQLLRAYSDGSVPAHYFIGEAPLAGAQVTVDGFVQDGEPVVMGIVDSVMYPGTISFMRFDYPSRLPAAVQARMADLARALMRGAGFDHGCFNIELFWDAERGALHVIEVNPRMSYQFADLYERVDGMHSYEVQLALATGRPVGWRAGAGRDGAAASFVMRRFSDGKVIRVPSA